MQAQALIRHLKFRLLAGVILAMTANPAAAKSTASNNRNVQKFKAQTTAKQIYRPNVTWFSLDIEDPPARPSPLQPPAQAQPAPPKPAFQTLPASPGAITVPVAELNAETTGTFKPPQCKECEEKAKGSVSEKTGQLSPIASAIDQATDNQSRKDKLAIAAVHQAVIKRKTADFCQGPPYYLPPSRTGNKSKCACAAGVKDALLESGLCNSRPNGDAVMMAGLPLAKSWEQNGYETDSRSSMAANCPAFRKVKGRIRSWTKNENTAWDAPAGSVIVYSTTRHKYGHVETVVQVSANNIDEIKEQLGGSLGKVKVGQKLWCSDYCRTSPTLMGGTNWIEAIYSL